MSMHNSLKSRMLFPKSRITANVARAKARKLAKRQERRATEESEAMLRGISIEQLRRERYQEADRARKESYMPTFFSPRYDYSGYRW
jgi:hypothetical protein